MPYAEKIAGIYKIENAASGKCYVGQSRNLHKRISEHFRLLRLGTHPNPRLQQSFRKHGEEAFSASIEIECEDIEDLDAFEREYLTGRASFDFQAPTT